MAKFNIYRMEKATEKSLLEKFHTVGLALSGQKQIDDFTLSLYFSQEPEDVDIWWTDLYADYLSKEDQLAKNKAYFAVFLVSNDSVLYAVSMGKSHFYLKDFCDINFGINLAERIADSNELKLKNSKLFGSKRNKIITAYQKNSELEYDSGESIHYVKASTLDQKKWGKFASFGNSVQFHLKIVPDDLPQFIKLIETELAKVPNINFPRSSAIFDEKKIAELDLKLSNEILNHQNANIQPAEATLSGVDFIFNDRNNYSLIFNRQSTDIDGDLTLSTLRKFINNQKIDLVKNINTIKIKVSDEYQSRHQKPLKFFLDYVDDDRHFLLDGKWHVFNQNFLEFLKKEIDQRIFFEKSDVHFSRSLHSQWCKSMPEGTKAYAEKYFNIMQEDDGYINLDRHINIVQKFKIELMDLYKDKTAYFVKFGKPQKLVYVIDQAVATIKILQSQTSDIHINEKIIKPKNICLWLILDRKGEIYCARSQSEVLIA